MPTEVTSPVRRGARVCLAILIAAFGVATVLAGPSMGGPPFLLQESPSGSTSPSPSDSASASASASTTPSPSPSPIARGVSLVAADRMIVFGRAVRLAGQVVSSDPACEAQQAVQIRRRFVGAPEFLLVETVHTDSSGNFATRLGGTKRSAEYRAVARQTAACETGASDHVAVFVRVIVTISVSENPIGQGNFFTISGAVKPDHRGSSIVLERKRLNGWSKVDVARLNRDSRYEFILAAGWVGERTFRVRWSSTDFDHESNKSRSLTLRSV